jgi:hypothetical protein
MESGEEALVRAIEQAGEVIDEYSDLLKVAPIAKYVVGAYRWIRTWRIKTFIRALNTAADDLSAEDREKLDKYLSSKPGLEILADFADAAVRSRSPTAIAALALLYADMKDQRYSKDFKAAAAHALEGISEDVVEAFLLLISNEQSIPHVPGTPYPVMVLQDSVVASSALLSG